MTHSGFLVLLPAACLVAAVFWLERTRRNLAEAAETERARLSRIALAVGLLGIAFLAAVQLDVAFGLNTDDAPITFRYAENLAEGRGFVYNQGERVLGTSTPLFTLVLAALRLCGLPVETSALLLALAGLAASVGLTLRLGNRIAGAGGGFLAAGLVLTEAPLLVYTTQGMETVCSVALILGALTCHIEGSEKTSAVLAAACVLMRLDGLAVVAALAFSYLLERRTPSGRAVVIFLVLVVPWFVFSWAYFGHILPQSLIAKMHHAKHSESFWMLRSLLLDGAVLFVPFGLLGLVRFCFGPAGRRNAAVPLWLGLYVAAFSIVAIDAYPWYRIPPIPVLSLLAAGGLSDAAGALLKSPQRWRRRATFAALLVGILCWGLVRVFDYRNSLSAYADQLRVWETPRVATAEWLREHAPPGSTVATSAIGHIGWISGLKILDTSGLVSGTPLGGFDVGRDRPEFIVGHDGDPQPGAVFRVDHPDYRLVQSLAVEPTVVYRIYKRNDVALRE